MQMLSARPRTSTIGYWFVDDPTGQAKGGHVIVAQVPDSSRCVTRVTGLLHPLAGSHVGEGDA